MFLILVLLVKFYFCSYILKSTILNSKFEKYVGLLPPYNANGQFWGLKPHDFQSLETKYTCLSKSIFIESTWTRIVD